MRRQLIKTGLVLAAAAAFWLGVELAHHVTALADARPACVEHPGGVLGAGRAFDTLIPTPACDKPNRKDNPVRNDKPKHKLAAPPPVARPTPVKMPRLPVAVKLPPAEPTPPPAPAPTGLDQVISIPEINTWPTTTNPVPAPVDTLPVTIIPITIPAAAGQPTPPQPTTTTTTTAAPRPDACSSDQPAQPRAGGKRRADQPAAADRAGPPRRRSDRYGPIKNHPAHASHPSTTTTRTSGGHAPTAGTAPGHHGTVEQQLQTVNWPTTAALTSAALEVEYRPI